MIQTAKELIESSNKITILTHKNPDGDTIGSGFGIYFALRKMGKKAYVVNKSSDIQRELKSVNGFSKLGGVLPENSDLIIAVDGANPERYGLDKSELEYIKNNNVKIINIDHHQSNTYFGDINIVDPSLCATALLVYKLLKDWGYEIDKEAASSLYFGLASDSGFFGYERVGFDTFVAASELCKLGANPNKTYNELRNSNSLAKMRLLGYALDSLSLHCDGMCGIMVLGELDFKKSGALRSDCDGIVNYAISLSSVKLGVLLREEESGEVRISFRSKGDLDTNVIANIFGGGGHRNASGASVKNSSIDEIKEMIIVNVAHLMFDKKRLLEDCFNG